jgi:hypothetical protein
MGYISVDSLVGIFKAQLQYSLELRTQLQETDSDSISDFARKILLKVNVPCANKTIWSSGNRIIRWLSSFIPFSRESRISEAISKLFPNLSYYTKMAKHPRNFNIVEIIIEETSLMFQTLSLITDACNQDRKHLVKVDKGLINRTRVN